MTTFEERVEFMKIVLIENQLDPSSPVVDQVRACDDEMFPVYSELLPVIGSMLDVEVGHMRRADISPDVAAFFLAACSSDDMASCLHIQSPTPMIIDLTHRRMLCRPCTFTAPRLEVDPDDDSCDFCRRVGVDQFWPTVSIIGGMIISGEACDSCVEKVRLL